MSKGSGFSGFSKETVRFFKGLQRNNSREWFDQNRTLYDKHVMEPAKAFVLAMGTRLRPLVPRIVAVPKINKSIFRINRDTRFSLDKSPYKTNLGIYFWEGPRSRMESSGFYFHLEPPILMLGGGRYIIPDHLLGRFRRAATDPRLGQELTRIITHISKLEGFSLGGKHYKRLPAGFDPAHPNAELLLFRGLYAGCEENIPEELFSERLIDYCFEKYKLLVPLHRWLVKALDRL